MIAEPRYDELDPPIVALCRAINALPGLRTMWSCGGHAEPLTAESLPADEWSVTLRVQLGNDHRPTLEGWLSFEWFTWFVHDLRRARAVALEVDAMPPWLNDPAEMVTLTLWGRRGDDGGLEPDEVAGDITREAAETLAIYGPECLSGEYWDLLEPADPDEPIN